MPLGLQLPPPTCCYSALLPRHIPPPHHHMTFSTLSNSFTVFTHCFRLSILIMHTTCCQSLLKLFPFDILCHSALLAARFEVGYATLSSTAFVCFHFPKTIPLLVLRLPHITAPPPRLQVTRRIFSSNRIHHACPWARSPSLFCTCHLYHLA